MAKNKRVSRKSSLKIRAVEATNKRLASRAGLAFFVAYLQHIEIYSLLNRWFGSPRKNKKGTDIT